MSKEKIIGLSVIGVLTATLAGVTGWRMMGGKATSPAPAALVADDKANADDKKDSTTGPTVLASATSSNDELAARLSGKTKIKGGWETASPASSAPMDPTLPAGAKNEAGSGIAAYDASNTDLNPTAGDQERHPSFMPRETLEAGATGEARYSTDVVSEESASTGVLAESSSESAYGEGASIEIPNELTPDPSALATSQTDIGAGRYGSSEPEAVQIVEPDQIPEASLVQQVESDPEAERAAIRAADDARFAATYAKEQEKVSIAESALAPQSTSLNAADEVPNLSEQAATTPPGRFAADARFTAEQRYAPAEESQLPTETLPSSVTPTEATVPEKTAQTPPIAANAGSVSAADAYGAQPSYRDSVYREPAAVSGAGSSPLPNSTKAPATSTTQTPAATPYVDHSQAAAPYGTSARSASVSTGSMHNAVAEKHVPQRENTGKYYVEPGDSMWTISKKVYGNGGFFKALQEHNRARFITPSSLQVGDEVLTPTIAELRDMYSGLCPKERIAKPGSPAATQATHMPVSQSVDVRQYEVQAGDTLYDIARYELGDASRWPEIFQLNRVALGVDIDYVKPGTKLILPMDAPIKASPESEAYRGDVLTRKPGDLRK